MRAEDKFIVGVYVAVAIGIIGCFSYRAINKKEKVHVNADLSYTIQCAIAGQLTREEAVGKISRAALESNNEESRDIAKKIINEIESQPEKKEAKAAKEGK